MSDYQKKYYKTVTKLKREEIKNKIEKIGELEEENKSLKSLNLYYKLKITELSNNLEELNKVLSLVLRD